MRLFTLVRREFAKSGISKAVLADRMDKGIDQISHWLSHPQNWTADTASDLLFAINGAVPKYDAVYPLGVPDQDAVRTAPTIHPAPVVNIIEPTGAAASTNALQVFGVEAIGLDIALPYERATPYGTATNIPATTSTSLRVVGWLSQSGTTGGVIQGGTTQVGIDTDILALQMRAIPQWQLPAFMIPDQNGVSNG